ncbi:MAG: TetR/AcrR family transcriptional regulator, partial [Anaerolineaceae bacterium]|nr:TetR/AcrR family transcriptional regulator [Anaerolineaceae bacterium]
EVAEAAGVTKPTLYHYFGSKQGLLHALLDTYTEPFNQAVQAAAEYRGDLPAALERLTRVYFNFAQENPVYTRMMLGMYFAPRQSEAYQALSSRNQQQYELVGNMFAAAVQNHGNMKERQQLYAATLIGMLNTCISLWLNERLALDGGLIQRVLHQYQYGIYS